MFFVSHIAYGPSLACMKAPGILFNIGRDTG
jgi:hypothetical protein